MVVGLLLGSFVIAKFALAGNLDVGLGFGQATGLGSADPRLIIANIIRIVLGFLGIIFIILIIYAGWLWLSAAGNADKIDKAKKVLIAAVIGLVIILASFAITSFILSKLLESTGGGGGSVCDPPCATGQFCCNGSCQLSPCSWPPPPPPPPPVSCDGNSLAPGCQADVSLCSAGQYCDNSCYCQNQVSCDDNNNSADGCGLPSNCTANQFCNNNCFCQSRGNVGDPCDSDTAMTGCQASDNMCSSDLQCNTISCTCQGAPVIDWVSPVDASSTPNGAVGNFITIGGRYFGTTTGQVYFADASGSSTVVASFPVSVNPNCTNNWQDNQIIVIVPNGARTGPIRVRRTDAEEDTTNNSRGPQINDFQVNSTHRPGLCLVNPSQGGLADTFNLQGAVFNGTTRGVLFGNNTVNVNANNIANWTNTSVNAAVPNLAAGDNTVFVRVDSSDSNSLRFKITVNATNNPVIDYIDPSQGPVNQYITIYGHNFKSYLAGTSLIKFYLPADPNNLINANIDFSDQCKNNWWHDSYVIIKVPNLAVANYKIIVLDRNSATSSPADFTVTTGSAGPGLCLISPHNGQVGQLVNAYGDNFKTSQGNAVFYNNLAGTINSWQNQQASTNVPSSAQTGPFKIVSSSGTNSNSLPFTMGSCTAASQCELGEECCGGGTYWSGICRAQGSCSQGAPGGCSYGWTFSTAAVTTILNCSGYSTANACLATNICPNSPGSCRTRTNLPQGDCSNNYCNQTYSSCSGNCSYNSDLNRCKLNGSSCDAASSTILPGFKAQCQPVGNKSVWQINSGGASCPVGSFMDTNHLCTVGNLGNPTSCQLCTSGFSCQGGQCTMGNQVCPVGATCQNNQCLKIGDICECCCRVGQEAQDCCAGLTCQPGNCGSGAPNYGLCTGCKVSISGTVNQAASDQACNCSGQSTRYCDLTNPAYPNGVCRDQSTQGQPCYDPATSVSCINTNPPCIGGLVCNPSSCTCQTGGGPGAPCDTNTTLPDCQASNNLCQTGLICNPYSCVCQSSGGQGSPCDTATSTPGCQASNSLCQTGFTCDLTSCTCQGGGSAGSACQSSSVLACSQGATSCLASYECLDKSSQDCRCCCNPSNDKCPAPLSCWANKSPCDTTSRGLCCGCTGDSQCSNGADGCSSDTCCRGRPVVVDPTNPANGAADVCRNVLVSATFDQAIDIGSFNNNMTLVGDYLSVQCPAGTKFLASSQNFDGQTGLKRIYRQVIWSLAKLLTPIFGQDVFAQANPSHNYCEIPGKVSGLNNTAGRGEITFAPDKLLDAQRIYYAIIKGDASTTDNIKDGVLSSYNIGLVGSDQDTFNAKTFTHAKIWSFKTGDKICRLDSVIIDPISYLFQTSQNDTGDDNSTSAAYDTIRDSDKVYRAQALANNGEEITPVDNVYNWRWDWKIDNEEIVKFLNGNPATNNNTQVLVAQNVKDGKTMVNATATILQDTVNNPTQVSQKKTGQAAIYVLMCGNPWPAIAANGTWTPWRDSGSNCTIAGSGCVNNNFELYYCRDAGGTGTADDLPAILKQAVVRGTNNMGTANNNDDILKEFYFLREDMPAVTTLSVSDQQTGGRVAASWTAVGGAAGYKLYYGTSSGKYDNFLNVGNATSRIISGLTNGQTYYFAVTAFYNTGAESAYSNELSVVPTDATPPSRPLGLSAQALSGAIDLTWTANSDDTVSYKVYYGTSSGVYGSSVKVEAKSNCSGGSCNAKINNLTSLTTYYFALSALDSYNNESQRSQISATPN